MSEMQNDEGFESPPSPSCGEILKLLLAEIEADPGAPFFPTLAEAYRRVGQAERAREIAATGLEHAPERMAGRVALGLALLDVGEGDQAREVLSAILEDVPELMAVLEEAGAGSPAAHAEPAGGEAGDEAPLLPRPEAQVASEHPIWSAPAASSAHEADDAGALRDEEIDVAFDEAEAEPDEMVDVNDVAEAAIRLESLDEPEGRFAPSDHPAFATATMADLLESQGDTRGAQRIRSSLTSEALEIPTPQQELASTEPVEDLAATFVEEPAREQAGDPLSAVAEELSYGELDMDAAEAPTLAPGVEPEHAALSPAEEASEERAASKARILATLEGWLENIRREVA